MCCLVIMILVLLALALASAVIYVSSYVEPVRADEVHTVTTPDLWRIRLCRYKPASGAGEPVFLCHGFMSNQFNFAGLPDASMVDALVKKGYDCWVIDLRGNESSIPPFGRTLDQPTMDDYLLRDIPAAIKYIRRITGYAKVHWVGHSMGGMLLYAYDVVLGGAYLASGTTLGSPVGFEGVHLHRQLTLGVLYLRRMSRRFFRFLEWVFVRVGYLLKLKNELVPLDWDNMNPRVNEKMLSSMMEVPPVPVCREMLQAVETRSWRLKDGQVDVFAGLKDLRVPVFAIFGAGDPFVPIPTAETFFNALKGPDKKMLILSKANGHAANYSHVDLVYGKRCDHEVFDPIADWLRAHPISERLDLEAERAAVEAARAGAPAAVLKDRGKPGKKAPAKKKPVAKKTPAAKKASAAKRKPAPKKPAAKKAVRRRRA